jgi:hypothetical protein
VRCPDGKSATVLRGDEDTLKGAVIDSRIEIKFGRVPFDGKRRPQRDRFEAI